MSTKPNGERLEVLRDGKLKVTIWKNHGEKGAFFSATPARTYEKDGELHDGNSYVGTDLLRLSELARRAYGRVVAHRSVERRNTDGEQPAPQPEPSA